MRFTARLEHFQRNDAEAAMPCVCRLAIPVVALTLVCSFRVLSAPPPAPTKEQIARLIEQLGSKEFGKREEASKQLWEAGEPAELALEGAAKSADAEVSRRAAEILDKFKWGIFPDTPKPVVELIRRYEGSELAAKQEVLRQLFGEGVPGCRALVRIATAEDDPEMRQRINRTIGSDVRRFMPLALVDNRYDIVEKVLQQSLQSEDLRQANLSHYCAYCLFRGTIDERIKNLSARTERTKQESELLAYLYRTSGNLRAAKEVAEKADLTELLEALLYEMGEWKDLATRELAGQRKSPEKLGYRAAYQRLAGDTMACDQTLSQFRQVVEEATPAEKPILGYYLAKALFLNDRPAEALEVLDRSGQYPMLFEILCVQFKYREAFALADKARKAAHKDLARIEIFEARTLYGLGEKEKAMALFAHRAEDIKPGNDLNWFEDLVDAEYRVGLKEQAFDHAAKILENLSDPSWAERLLGRLFPGHGDVALVWWTFARKTPARNPSDAMKLVRDLLDGRLGQKQVEDLITAAHQGIKQASADESDRLWLALAETAGAAKLPDLRKRCLEQGGPQALLQLGDTIAEKKDWAGAAALYRRAWDKAPSEPLPLFLAGNALMQAGNVMEGKKLMEQSHILLLGDDQARNDFAVALSRRGFAYDAHREGDLLQRVGVAGSSYHGDAGLRQAQAAVQRKDYLGAAKGQERTLLRCLKPYVRFSQNPAYLGVPTLAHRFRARGLLEAGQFDEAWKEIAYCRGALPGDVDLAILVVPELDRRGHKKEADELFDQTAAVYAKIRADYPRCGWAHNSVAWLSVCCGRELEAARSHAQKAVDLAPDSAGHHDTLAEIYFQLGEKEKAVAEQQKAIALDPTKAYFRKQLKRIEAGDPKAERPSELEGDG
jgi:tetratricopeptide (TPR) repeat protein